jgi:hypothetical protein
MEFIEFVKTLPKQEDKRTNEFVHWASQQKDFPDSSHPVILAQYLYDKLDWDMAHTYQKLYVFYEKVIPNNRVPRNYKGQEKLMEAINIIVDLKNKAGHNPEIAPAKEIEATRPGEYVCFYPCSIPTERDGDVFAYVFVDAFSDFVIMTGIEKNDSDKNILKHMRMLLEDERFAFQNGPFTVVMHKYYHLTKAINVLFEPFGGKVIINDHYVTDIVAPVMESLFEKLAGGLPKA